MCVYIMYNSSISLPLHHRVHVHGDKCSSAPWPLTFTSALKTRLHYLGELPRARPCIPSHAQNPLAASRGPRGGARLIPRPRSSHDPPLSLRVWLLSLMVLQLWELPLDLSSLLLAHAFPLAATFFILVIHLSPTPPSSCGPTYLHLKAFPDLPGSRSYPPNTQREAH